MRCRCGQDQEKHDKYKCKNENGEFIEDYRCKECTHYMTSHSEAGGCHSIIQPHPDTLELVDLNTNYICPCERSHSSMIKGVEALQENANNNSPN